MGSEKWKAAYGRKNRPQLEQISVFLGDEVAALFTEFSRSVGRLYDVGCKPPKFTETNGWVYSFGRSAVTLISSVVIEEGAFTVQGVRVFDKASLGAALEKAAQLYFGGYRERFETVTAEKNRKQAESTKRRIERERKEIEAMEARIDKERFNRYRWSPKVSRQKLKRLYDADAKGIPDEELCEEIGYTLYTRCLQGRDERIIMESRQMKCHGCGEILRAKNGLIECKCGAQYLYRDYRRSFRTNNMPSGAATAIFNAFVENWPNAKGYAAQMRLIDGLVHEFHTNLNSGVRGRFVAINLIEGTKKQIGELINTLAYGKA